MHNLILIPFFILISILSIGQAAQEITSSAPLTIDGIAYAYTLSMPVVKTIDGVPYSFYEIKCDVTNLEKFSKIFLCDKVIKGHDRDKDLSKRAYLANLMVRNGAPLKDFETNFYITADFDMQVITYVKGPFGIINKTNIDGFNLEPGRTLTITKTIAMLNTAPPNVVYNFFGLSPNY